MHDDPIDLTPLDPDTDPGAEDRFVGAVMARLNSRANPYPVRVDPLWGAWSLAKPVLIAASIAIAIAGSLIVRASNESDAPLTVAESVGVPALYRAGAIASAGGQGR